jgi:hypothetical protein
MTQQNLNPQSPFFHEERYATLVPHVGQLITICGAGTLGANLCETLARMGFTSLRIIDKDRIEARNLSVQPYSRAEVGAPKARALATMLYRAVQAKVESHAVELTASNASQLLAGSAIVIDAFDNVPSRAIVSQTTLAAGLPCLHIGFSPDGLYGNGIWEPYYQVPHANPGDPCDYPLTRPLALTLTARAITDYLCHGQTYQFELTWTDLKIHLVKNYQEDKEN